MTREGAIWWVNHLFAIEKELLWNKGLTDDAKEVETAQKMAIEALSSNAIAKAYNQGFVAGSVNATVNSNYVCPRCGEKMEHKE